MLNKDLCRLSISKGFLIVLLYRLRSCGFFLFMVNLTTLSVVAGTEWHTRWGDWWIVNCKDVGGRGCGLIWESISEFSWKYWGRTVARDGSVGWGPALWAVSSRVRFPIESLEFFFLSGRCMVLESTRLLNVIGKKVSQSRYRPEVPTGFQEFKVPRLRDNGPEWW